MAELKLKHVEAWIEGTGWVHVDDPADLDIHAYATVSANRELFRCSECGQYVILTREGSYRRHFKHSKQEREKDCPDRTNTTSNSSRKLDKHYLPLRLVLSSNNDIHFEIGFVRLPEEWYDNITVEIKPSNNSHHSYIYNQDRFFFDATTYLSVGSTPANSYQLTIKEGNPGICSFWPNQIPGIETNGSLFEKNSGLLKPCNSDVVVGKQYYVLTNGRLNRVPSSIHYNWITSTSGSIPNQLWNLYSIEASKFDQETASFFQRYSYRLAEREVMMQPVWPLYKESSFSIQHNQPSMYMFITGKGTIDYYPKKDSKAFSKDNNQVVWFHSLERQQVMAIGKYETIAYSYFWKTSLSKTYQEPVLDVLSIDESTFPPGNNFSLPHSKCLLVSSKYYGHVERWKRGKLINNQDLKPSSKTMVNDIGFGEEIKVFIGLDCVWSASFIKEHTESLIDEREIVKQLDSNKRSLIPAPHALKRIAVEFKPYPLIQAWIRKTIKSNQISQQSYRQLQELYRNLIVNNQ